MEQDVTIEHNVAVSVLHEHLYQRLTANGCAVILGRIAVLVNVVGLQHAVGLILPCGELAVSGLVAVNLVVHELELVGQTPFASLVKSHGRINKSLVKFLVVLHGIVYVDILLQVDVAIVVELKGCATCICQSLLRRIPDVHLGVFVTETSKTLLVTCLRALLKIHLAVHWLDSPCESLELSLQWVEESVVGSDNCVLGSELVVLRLHLQGNRVVLLVSFACWCLVQLVWMCNLKTCCQDTVAVQECGCAIVLLLRRCHAKHLCRILPGACLHVHHLRLQHVVTLNVAILCIGVGRIHVILHSPCRTIDIIFATCCRNRIVRQEV